MRIENHFRIGALPVFTKFIWLLPLGRMKIALKVDDRFYKRYRIFQKIIFMTDLLTF